MNVVGVSHLTDKFMRIAKISSLVENGTIQFCLDGTQQALINQLLFLGKIKDDLADALESAVALAREMNFQPVLATAPPQTGVGERAPTNGRGMLSRLFAQQASRNQGERASTPQDELIQRARKSVWPGRR